MTNSGIIGTDRRTMGRGVDTSVQRSGSITTRLQMLVRALFREVTRVQVEFADATMTNGRIVTGQGWETNFYVA